MEELLYDGIMVQYVGQWQSIGIVHGGALLEAYKNNKPVSPHDSLIAGILLPAFRSVQSTNLFFHFSFPFLNQSHYFAVVVNALSLWYVLFA